MGIFTDELITDTRAGLLMLKELTATLELKTTKITEDFNESLGTPNGEFRLWCESELEWNTYLAAKLTQYVNTNLRVTYSDTTPSSKLFEAKVVLGGQKYDFIFKAQDNGSVLSLVKV